MFQGCEKHGKDISAAQHVRSILLDIYCPKPIHYNEEIRAEIVQSGR
jgi:hypothetical protein